MKKRTLLTTAALTALVLSFGALQPAPVEGAAELASHVQPLDSPAPATAENPTTPQWSFIWGWEGNESLVWDVASLFVCAAFALPGAIACGLTGIF